MKHRDQIIIQKVISEIDVGLKIFNNISFDEFNNNETIKRAFWMIILKINQICILLICH